MVAERATEVDAYLDALPAPAAAHLREIREALHAGLPDGRETVRYGMPAIVLGTTRHALHFAGWKAHAGIYPVPDLGGELEEAVAPYRRAKDTVALRYRDPMPAALLTRLAERFAQLRG